jgi:hypothetical protein
LRFNYGISDSTYANMNAETMTPAFAQLSKSIAEQIRQRGCSPVKALQGVEANNLIRNSCHRPAVIDPDLLKQVARIVSRVHAEAQIRLPADAQATELANAYNLLDGQGRRSGRPSGAQEPPALAGDPSD